jgi:hypothetical protein
MHGSISQVPVADQPRPVETPSAILSARVQVGFNFAVSRICGNVSHIAHADEKAEAVVWLAIHDVLVRAASDPNVTVTQVLEAFFELAPEGAPRKNDTIVTGRR